MGHVPDPLTKFAHPLYKSGKILEIKVEVSGEKRTAPEGMWVLGSNIEIPAIFYIREANIDKYHVRKCRC